MHNEDKRGETGGIHPLQAQLDPGLLDWRYYTIAWYGSRKFADIIATRIAGGGYNAGKEYWIVDKSMLTNANELVVANGGDKSWTDPVPMASAGMQEFVANCAATWTQVTTDLTTGILYKHATQDYYVRIVLAGTAPTTTISALRWYQKDSTAPAPSFDPSGTYTEVSALGSGTIWYADSK
ncbi:hypothetical protein [Polyangium mundeleinium]|uniref:Uncharacterized protein n=1 Tax=Polyangium mundeleinium TaxID=2995306 RepID=A0ABT5EXJ3_9BACT|nr:hypothetical protein [Polyangium mundeleinium]MDC0746521.1 hypothetical protein [Polyangium mundeleinium]